jgi:superfamily II DNA or RNA helicase
VPSIRLRAWQQEALAALEQRRRSSFLAVATPGAGKTTFALAAIRRALVARHVRRIVVVVPTQHLKTQWAEAAERFDVHLDPAWSAGDGALPSDVHGIVTTYQGVAADPKALRRVAEAAFVVLDEIHHAADARAWGDSVRHAFTPAWLRLCMSGTPFRSDQSAIPFIHYEREEAVPDYEYGYGNALRDASVVLPVYFPRINGRMEWSAPSGETYEASFSDPLGRALASQRLRTALDLEGMWLPAVLTKAHRQLEHLRQRDPRAGGMVIAMDQDHARGIERILRSLLKVRATVAVSDDAAASKKIAEFTAGDAPWIVAVRMVSEGVDIPRLRVGVYATNTVTDLFFRQAVGRLVRVSDQRTRQLAYMFIPDEPRLRVFAAGIAEQRRHSLRKPERHGEEMPAARVPLLDPLIDEQLSLFSAISAIPLDEHGLPLESSAIVEPDGTSEPVPDLVGDGEREGRNGTGRRAVLVLTGSEADVEVPTPEPDAVPAPPVSARSRRLELRELNSARVRRLVHSTKRGHADVNAQLNRAVGIKRVTEATIVQLERRLAAADRWLQKL